jgi:hypothetical protein
MLTFLLYTLVFWLAGACIVKIWHFAIQPTQALDLLFHWQNMLAKMYSSKYKTIQLFGKALGDCEMCMSFWFNIIWYAVYVAFLWHIWPWHTVWMNIIWFVVYHSIGTIIGLFTIIKLFGKK